MKFKETKEVYGKTLLDLGEKNSDIFVVEADLMKASGTKPFQDRFAERHINVGIAEQNLVGIAAGLAADGRIPFACTMANFLSQRACDQVAMSVSYNKFNVKLVGCYAGLTQEKNGGTHISIMDLTVARCLPNMNVFVPGDCNEFDQIIRTAASLDGPVYIRMPKLLPENILGNSHRFVPGKVYPMTGGDDITIIATGITTGLSLEAVKMLEADGIKARLIHLPTLKPLDKETVLEAVRGTGIVLTVENHSVLGGLGSLVSEILSSEKGFQVFRIGMKDTFGLTADLAFQLDYFGISAEKICVTVKELLTEIK